MAKTPAERMSMVRGGMFINHPFFASLAIRQRLVETKDVPTMGTDSVTLFYNPEWISTLTNKELLGVLCHEMMHVALGHTFRIGARNMDKWNTACDYAVNDLLLKQEDIVLPASRLYDKKYEGMSAEHIYNILKSDKGPGNSSIGDVKQYKQDPNATEPSDSTQGSGYEATAAEQEQKVKSQVQQAAMAGKQAGKLSEDLDRLVTEQLKTVVPWKEVLARFITQTVFNDYSWTRPSKRYQHMGVYLPQLSVPELSPVACIVDTSGSIGQREINLLTSELQGIFYAFPETTVDVVYVDTRVCKHEEICASDIHLHPKGGGGTDFRPGFKFIEKLDKGHACILYFTDGWCNEFPKNVDLPTLWIITPNGHPNFTPPFGEVINLED